MATNRKRLLNSVLLEAFDRPEAERQAFLADACRGDDDLLQEAQAMLALEDQLDGFLEEPAYEAFNHPPSDMTAPDRPAAMAVASATGPVARPGTDDTTPLGGKVQPTARRRIGDYEIIGRVGSGGMGQVYLGEDRRLGRMVAIKTLLPDIAEEQGWLERFKREARALASLNHPNIVTIHSIEEDDGVYFLTMELVEGKTLRETIPDDGLPLDDLLRIAKEITDALVAAHGRGVIHRDLKPVNVMITGDGRPKILDFGIAKVSGHDLTRPDDGRLGTLPYMAPEQFQGEPVDNRADLFSFGIMLYMMATGQHPFPGATPYQRALAIMGAEPQPAAELRPDLPADLGLVIARCLEKDPERRYQEAAELRTDLADLLEYQLAEKALESRSDLQSFRRTLLRRAWLRRAVVATSVVAVVALIVGIVGHLRPPAPVGGPTGQAQSTTLAVLPFKNLTGNPETDWLANGISELLVTDVSQSPELTVLRTRDLKQILEETGITESTELSPEVIRKVAEAGGATAVIYGSYIRLGDVLRIAYTIDNPLTGDMIRSDSLERRGETGLFSIVDQIGAAILESCQASRPGIGPEKIQEATTGSFRAWQAYTEAQILYNQQSKPVEALAKLEEALHIDPHFALAYSDASRIHQSLGHVAAGQEYAQRAFELIERLPLRIRLDVEASYYAGRWATLSQAIESYELALRVYPLANAWRNNLARCLTYFEMYSQSLTQFQTLIAPGQEFWGNYFNAAMAHAALGDFEAGHRLLDEFTRKQPKNWRGHFAMAWHLTEWGRYDEAAAAFDRAASLRHDASQIPYARWRLAVMREQWQQADTEARRLLEFDDTFARWWGPIALAQNALYRGRAEEALSWLDDAINGSTEADRAFARCLKAELLLVLGENKLALRQAEEAQTEGTEQWPELRSLFLAALSEQALHRSQRADALQDALRDRWLRQPNVVEERQLHHLSGLLSLARGDMQTGRQALAQAAALLPEVGTEFHWHIFPFQVPIRTDLAEIELFTGHTHKALGWLNQVTESGSEHLMQPVPFVRSFYLKGIAHCRLGDHDAARRSFEKYLGYWGSGDIDREAVAAARAYLEEEESPPPTPSLFARLTDAGTR